MSRKHLQEIIRNLQEFYKCPSCDVSYQFDDIKVLGQIDQYCFVQLSCHACSLPVLATVAVTDKKPGRPRSDLKTGEKTKFSRLGSISSGEIADFHSFISRHKGSIGKLT